MFLDQRMKRERLTTMVMPVARVLMRQRQRTAALFIAGALCHSLLYLRPVVEQQAERIRVALNLTDEPLAVRSSWMENETDITCLTEEGETSTFPSDIPSFIIIGTQKGGTSALFDLLSRHPSVQSSTAFEAHFFDFEVGNLTDASPELLCSYRSQYINDYFDVHAYREYRTRHVDQPLFTFEKTPAYIRRPGVPQKMFHLLGHGVKLVAILRDPVERMYSAYKMGVLRKQLVNVSFDHVVEKHGESLRDTGFSSAPLLSQYDASSADFAPNNLSFDERRLIVHRKDTWTKPGQVKRMRWNLLYGGMYAMQLAEWFQYYLMDQHLKIVEYERLQENRSAVFAEILEFLGIPQIELDPEAFDQDFSPVRNKKKRPLDSLKNRTREYLYAFYRPYNDELADLLGEQWRGLWSPR